MSPLLSLHDEANSGQEAAEGEVGRDSSVFVNWGNDDDGDDNDGIGGAGEGGLMSKVMLGVKEEKEAQRKAVALMKERQLLEHEEARAIGLPDDEWSWLGPWMVDR